MRERLDTRQLAPILFALGQKVAAPACVLGEESLTNLFIGAFSGLFAPELQDPLHQGIALDLSNCSEPFQLLPSAYAKIRSWLLDGDQVLPALPLEWEAGRVFGLKVGPGRLDIEWRKHRVYRMAFHGGEPPEFVFGKKVSGFRRRVEGAVTQWDRFATQK